MHPKLRTTLVAVVLALGLFSLSPAIALANVTPYDVNQCSQLNMQDPHISGSYGVLQKSQWQCNTAPTTVNMQWSYYDGWWLWVCPSAGPQSESWIQSNCTIKGNEFITISWSTAGSIQTHYLPNNGQHTSGNGYWVACPQWFSTGPNGQGQTFLTFSNYVYINAP